MLLWLLLAAIPNPNTGNGNSIPSGGGSIPGKIINPVTCGADPTGVKDSAGAINTCIRGMSSVSTNSVGYTLSFPPGVYRLSSSIDIVRRLIMTCNVAISNKTPACYFMPDMGVTAIIVHSANDGSVDGGTGQFSQIENVAVFGTPAPSWTASTATTLNSWVQPDEYSHYVMQATGVSSDTHTGGSEPSWSITDFAGTGSPVGTTIVDNHVTWTYNFSPGIWCRATCLMSHVSVDSVSGDSIAVVADTGNSPPTNANGTTIEHAYVQDANGNGLYIRGGDSNAGHFSDMDFEGNINGWCVYDFSFLGNKHVAHQCATITGLGAYYLQSTSAAGSLDDSYSEGTLASKIISPSQLIGGFAAQHVTTDSTGLIISGGTVKTDLIFGDTVDGTTLQLGGATPAGGQGVQAFTSPTQTTYTHFGYTAPGWWTLNVANLADKIFRPYSWTDVNTTWGTAQFWTPNGIYVGWVDNSTPGSKLRSDTAQPVSGIFKQGDFDFNQSPTAGSALGWRCIASSGTPASCSSWETVYPATGAAGISSFAAVGSSPSSSGATVSGGVATLQPADGTHPGLVTTGAQTWAGIKTLSSAPIMSGASITSATIPISSLATDPTNASNITSGTLPQAQGGTGATTQTLAFAAFFKTIATTLGDLVYGGSSGTPTRLAGDTSNTKKFLTETSSGAVAAAPTWGTIAAADVPSPTVSAGLTALANNAQSGCLALTSNFNVITTSTSTNNSVCLPTPSAGAQATISLSPQLANAVNVYPPSGGTINSGTTNFAWTGSGGGAFTSISTGVSIERTAVCYGTSSTNWNCTDGPVYYVGHQAGSTGNIAANAGEVGEVIRNTLAYASAVALSSGTTCNVGATTCPASGGTQSITLTPGDWSCQAMVGFKAGGATSVTSLTASISKTTNAASAVSTLFLPTSAESRVETDPAASAFVTANGDVTGLVIPPYQILVGPGTTQVLFLTATATFSISTLSDFGSIECRRMR
jgi:hypothetical protein